MGKIKVKYVAQVEIFGECDEDTKGIIPFDKIRYNVKNNLTPNIQHYIESEIDGCDVIITQIFADAWRMEDERTD